MERAMRGIRSGLLASRRVPSGAALFNNGPLVWISLAVDGLWEWRRRHRSRHQLKVMSDHMCKDIGISRADAWREGRKPFWKA
jgi:uncharacterized protein YjiS (DUF1127 family)